MNRPCAAIALPAVCAACLLALAAGYQQRGRRLAEQADELELLRMRTECQSKQIRDAAVYVPFLEESLARYQTGSPDTWKESARRLNVRRAQENKRRARRAIGAKLRTRYEGSDGATGGADVGKGER